MQTVHTKRRFSRHTNLESEMIKQKWIWKQSDEMNTTTVRHFGCAQKSFMLNNFEMLESVVDFALSVTQVKK